jgi:hypothetical protein
MNVTCEVCGLTIGTDGKNIIEHKHNGKICYGSYTPVNKVNPFKSPIPEKQSHFEYSSYHPNWDLPSSDPGGFIDLSTVPNRR